MDLSNTRAGSPPMTRDEFAATILDLLSPEARPYNDLFQVWPKERFTRIEAMVELLEDVGLVTRTGTDPTILGLTDAGRDLIVQAHLAAAMPAAAIKATVVGRALDGTRPPEAHASMPELAVAYLCDRFDPAMVTPQRDLCQRAAQRLGVQIIAEYIDVGSSAAQYRPGLDHMLAQLPEMPAVRYVLVAGLDRLTRSTSTHLRVSETLSSNRVALVDARAMNVISPLNLHLQAAMATHVTDLTGQASEDTALADDGG